MQHGKSWDYVGQSIENTTSKKSTIIIIIKHVWWNHEYYFSRSKTSQFFSYNLSNEGKNISLPIKLIFKCSQMVLTQGSRSTRFTATSRLSTFFLNIFLPHVLRNQLKIWTDIQKHIHTRKRLHSQLFISIYFGLVNLFNHLHVRDSPLVYEKYFKWT